MNGICRKVTINFDKQCSGTFPRNLKITAIVAFTSANVHSTKNKSLWLQFSLQMRVQLIVQEISLSSVQFVLSVFFVDEKLIRLRLLLETKSSDPSLVANQQLPQVLRYPFACDNSARFSAQYSSWLRYVREIGNRQDLANRKFSIVEFDLEPGFQHSRR